MLGASRDKDIKGMARELCGISDRFILTRSKVQRAEDPARIKEFVTKKCVITQTVPEALAKALQTAGPGDLVLVTGSFFVIGEAKEALGGKSAL